MRVLKYSISNALIEKTKTFLKANLILLIVLNIVLSGKVYLLFDFNIFYIILGLIIFKILFIITLKIYFRYSVKSIMDLFSESIIILNYLKFNKSRFLFNAVFVLIEELFWRGYLQSIYFDSFEWIIMLNLFFTLIHNSLYTRKLYYNIEFFIFFLIVSITYYFTVNIYSVFIIHFMRNLYIEYLKNKCLMRNNKYELFNA